MHFSGSIPLKGIMSNPKQLIFPFSLDKKSSIKKFFVPNGCANLIAAIKDNNVGDIFLSGKKGVGKSAAVAKRTVSIGHADLSRSSIESKSGG